MSARRKKQKTASASIETPRELSGMLEQLALGLVGMGWMLRWLTVTEAAAAGETLWVTMCWLLAATLFCWSSFRRSQWATSESKSSPDLVVRINLVDLGILLISVGHLLGCAWLFFTGGELRSAVNLSWEWVGLLITYGLLRLILVRETWRRDLITLVLASAVLLALVGVWQHYVWYEKVGQEYLTHKAVYTALQDKDPATWNAQQKQDYQAAIKYFELQQIPLQSDALDSWENRLLGSREPLGFFALTNTFAGLLLFLLGVWLALGVSARSDRPTPHRHLWVSWLFSLGLILYVLLLTKSRTAWGALLIVGGILLLSRWSTRALRWALVGVGGLCCLGAISWATGAIDLEVFSEAPRSLQYRFTYWSTSWQMLTDSPWFGTGPGNFRSAYLQYRPAGVSEEIADPHQFLLDLWANGGLLALTGVLFIAISVCGTWIKTNKENKPEVVEAEVTLSPGNFRSPICVGGLVAFLLVAVLHGLDRSGFEGVLVLATLGTMLMVFLLNRWFQSWVDQLTIQFSRYAPWLLGGLLIHLTATGGIEMPGLVMLLLAMLALVADRMPLKGLTISVETSFLTGAGAILGVLLMGGMYWTAWLPVQQANRYLELAEEAQLENVDPQEVWTLYQQGIEADPWEPSVANHCGDFLLFHANQRQREGQPLFDDAVQAFRKAWERDPHNPRRYYDLGRVFQAQFEATGKQESRDRAVENYREAIRRYPTHVGMRADLALFLAQIGLSSEAENQAKEALRLDELNKVAGHTDQRLDVALLERLKQLVSSTSE
ncbi:MAG: O-antigen ligase family protein [Planctomycetaceae bacterium]|nr:O-antigen ligase family protein [Planctomycetaceae bacterium]